MIEKMRAKIIELGGEIRFSQRVDDILFEDCEANTSETKTDTNESIEADRKVVGVKLATGEIIKTQHVALAVGHSARDTFKMLNDKDVYMVAKPFSIGFRIEHEQSVIDDARFGKNAGHPILGSADYKLVHH